MEPIQFVLFAEHVDLGEHDHRRVGRRRGLRRPTKRPPRQR
jgi:hypothetical protein